MLTHPLYARPWALRRSHRRCLWCGGEIPDRGEPGQVSAAAGRGPSGTEAAGAAGDPGAPEPLHLDEPRGPTVWRACRGAHRAKLAQVLRWAERRSAPLRVGIMGAVIVFLAAAATASVHRLGTLTTSDAVAFFRLAVAVTVLPLGWFSASGGRDPSRSDPPRSDGPRSNPARSNPPRSNPARSDPARADPARADGVTSGAAARIRTPFPVHIQALIGTWAVLWLFRLVGLLWLAQGILHLVRRAAPSP